MEGTEDHALAVLKAALDAAEKMREFCRGQALEYEGFADARYQAAADHNKQCVSLRAAIAELEKVNA